MSESSKDMLDLVLGYEELEGAQKERADRILAANPRLARHLDDIRNLEKRATDPVPLGSEEDFWGEEAGVALDRRRMRTSLEELRHLAGVRPRVSRTNHLVRWALPLAAVLALALVLPHWISEPAGSTDLRVVRAPLAGDTSRATEVVGDDGLFRSGESIALSFELDHPAHVVFCLVDAAGGISTIVPRGGQPFGAGTHIYPDAGAAGRWILNDTIGMETFLVAIREDSLPDTLGLRRSLAQLEGQGDRERTVEAAQKLLTEDFDEVKVVRFQHVN